MALPKEEITPFNKTMNYLEGLVSPYKPEPHTLSPQATAFVPSAHSANADVETADSEFQRQITFSEPSPQVHPKPTTQLVQNHGHRHKLLTSRRDFLANELYSVRVRCLQVSDER